MQFNGGTKVKTANFSPHLKLIKNYFSTIEANRSSGIDNIEIGLELEIPSYNEKTECKLSLDLYAVKKLCNRVYQVNYFIIK